MDLLEETFLSKTQKLTDKRQAQLKKRMERMLPDLEKAFEENKLEEVERTLETMKIPSSKEWAKNIHSLVDSSARAGVLRAHLELLRLKELYEFDENDWSVDIQSGGNSFEVNFPKEAEEWLQKYSYEIGVITDETVREKIKEETLRGLREGVRGRDLTARINRVTETWVTQRHSETIARTETAKMYNAGRIARWLDPESNGFVEALQYDAIVDTRTTDLCKGLDGKIVATSNAQAIANLTPPNHFMCRATWIPVTRYEEWEDNFPSEAEAQKGFDFEAPLPKLLQKKVKPLVQPVVTVPLDTITDIAVIRSLPDDDFRVAIGNVTDTDEKLSLIQERAEAMLASRQLIKEKIAEPQFSAVIKDSGLYFKAFGETLTIPTSTQTHQEFLALVKALEKKPNDIKHFQKLVDEFTSKHEGEYSYLIINKRLKKLMAENNIGVEFKGFEKVTRSEEARKKYTIKMPVRQTPAYKKAVGLQEALRDGEKWLQDYMHDKTAPKDGIELVFSARLGRAYAYQNTINFGVVNSQASVVVHESGHVIHNNPLIGDLVNAWFMKRTDKLKLPQASRMGEKVIPDDFFESYIGRIYGWEKSNRYGQEVLSMGLQAMYENPAKFYKEDKDHFLFTYAIMEGLF